jgi:hypothetical protein
MSDGSPDTLKEAAAVSLPKEPEVDRVAGVDRHLVERFLLLVRDNYPKADRATFFLEEVAGKTHTLVMANLRDVLSHLATMLSTTTPRENWEAQLASAEEHFRRAIQEPYAIALGSLRERFSSVFPRYQDLLPRMLNLQKHGLFDGIPTVEIVQTRLRRINELASEGRSAKRLNHIDANWDSGVGSCVEAYDKLEALTHELSGHIHQYDSRRDSQIGKVLSWLGLAGTVVFGAVSLLLVVLPRWTAALQDWLHIPH